MLKYSEEEGKNCREREGGREKERGREGEREGGRERGREKVKTNHDLFKITNIFLFFSEAFTLKTICNFK